MVIDGYRWLFMVNVYLKSAMDIGGYQWLSVTLRIIFIYFKTMVIMVIDGYRWLLMVINVCLNSAMVILGYQWLSVVICDIENNFYIQWLSWFTY